MRQNQCSQMAESQLVVVVVAATVINADSFCNCDLMKDDDDD